LPLFVITNGSHWNSKIESLINDLDFDVAVSIDAVDKDIVEGIRKNIQHEKLMQNIRRFSEVCRKKGKYLSLSFTVQKDNWRELPRVIELCNEVEAFIFVSYLERPVEFSITEFSTAELQEVLAFMKTISLPRLSQKERHNYRCFVDFKKYIQTYITNPEEKRYLDYRFEAELIQNEAPELIHKRKDVVIEKTISFEKLQIHLHHAIKNSVALSNVNLEAVNSKIREVLIPFSEEEKVRIYSMMALGEPETTIHSLLENDVESLQAMAKESLPYIKIAAV